MHHASPAATPATAQTQVPPPLPIPADPPPTVSSKPPRRAPDAARPRFTEFYRPANLPPRRPSVDEPVRKAGRTPYTAPMPMPMSLSTPAPIPMSNNPLSLPPANVWGTSRYRHVLANLPVELPDLLDLQYHHSKMLLGDPEHVLRPSSRLAGVFGSRDKGGAYFGRGALRSRATWGDPAAGVDTATDTRERKR